jgi:hypothetical protein
MIMAAAYFRRGISWDRLDGPSSGEIPDRTFFYAFVLAVVVNRNWVSIRLAVEKTFRFLTRSSKNTLKSCRSSGAMQTLQTLSKVSSCETLSRLSRVSSRDALSRLSTSILKSFTSSASRRRAALQAITTKECFARLDYIEQLSVGDITVLFRYAASVNHADFIRKQFLAGHSDLIRAMVTAIDLAVKVSRGSSSEAAKIASNSKQGDIDALYFLATTRIFAEWRTVRMVPKGFKRYSVAMNLAYRDVLQNSAKIESAVHAYLKYHLGSLSDIDQTIPSPSLRQLLQYELDTNVHSNLPRLTDYSAASGLLWIKRQLHYQEVTFANTLQIPAVYPSSKDAGGAAYREVYESCHGWAVKQIFQNSFGASPSVEAIWKAMVPPKKPFKASSVKASSASTKDSPRRPRGPGRKLSDVSEDTFPLDGERPENEIIVALDNFGKHITGEWNKLLNNFNCVTDEEHKQANLVACAESFLDIQGGASTSFDSVDDNVDDNVVEQQVRIAGASASPVDKVKREIEEHIQEMWPIVGELSGLIEELNMNDPTKA